jgi:hypothetical protein
LFKKDKYTCITEIGNKIKGSTELIENLYLTSNTALTEFSCLTDAVQFTKKDNVNIKDKIIIPYNRDLTNYNKTTFHQSIIDHTSINNSNGDLYNKITSNQKYSTTIKTLVYNDIFPKTTKTLLTAHYTSYIKTNLPQVTNSSYKQLIYYYAINEIAPVIVISVINSTYISSQLTIEINNSNNIIYKKYTIEQHVPKFVIYLTADLAAARPGRHCIYSISILYRLEISR